MVSFLFATSLFSKTFVLDTLYSIDTNIVDSNSVIDITKLKNRFVNRIEVDTSVDTISIDTSYVFKNIINVSDSQSNSLDSALKNSVLNKYTLTSNLSAQNAINLDSINKRLQNQDSLNQNRLSIDTNLNDTVSQIKKIINNEVVKDSTIYNLRLIYVDEKNFIKREKSFYIVSIEGYWQNRSLDSTKKELKAVGNLYSRDFVDSTKLNQPFNSAFASIDIELNLYYPYLLLNTFIVGVGYRYGYLDETYNAVIMYKGDNSYSSEKAGLGYQVNSINFKLLFNINNNFIKLNNYNNFYIKSSFDYHFNEKLQYYRYQNSNLIDLKSYKVPNSFGFSLGLLFYKKLNKLKYSFSLGKEFYSISSIDYKNRELNYSDLSVLFQNKPIELDLSGIYFNFEVGF